MRSLMMISNRSMLPYSTAAGGNGNLALLAAQRCSGYSSLLLGGEEKVKG